VRLIVLILVLLPTLPAPADVIHLKNGRTIWADQVRESKDHVEYDLGEDTYAIPRSSVDRIETGGVAPVRGGSGASTDVPDIAPPAPTFSHAADVAEKVIRDNKVDVDALAAFAQSGDAEVAATAYFLAGKHEFEHGNFPAAKRYYESALRFEPDNSTLLVYYAAALSIVGLESALAIGLLTGLLIAGCSSTPTRVDKGSLKVQTYNFINGGIALEPPTRDEISAIGVPASPANASAPCGSSGIGGAATSISTS